MLRFFAISILILYCSATSVTENKTISLELIRQRPPFEHYLNYIGKFNGTLKEFHKGKKINDSISLYRFLNNEFYGKVVIGHPGQTLNVAFDTTWSLSWVISSKCSSIKMIGCWFHNKYDHSKSSEYKADGRPYVQKIGKYNLTGFYSFDNFSVAHSNVTAMSFVEMANVPYTFLFSKIDGIVGFGLKTSTYEPFFYKLYNQKKIKDPIFSIYLNRDMQSNRGGNIMLGFIDEKHIHKNRIKNKTIPEEFTYLKVDKEPYWQFNMDKVVVNKNSEEIWTTVCKNGCKAIVDTSSNSIIGPKSDIDAIHDVIQASEFFLNRYTIDCDTIHKLPKIDFVLSGKNFTLDGSAYTVKLSYHSVTLCLSAFEPAEQAEEESRWDLGGAFLSEFYSVYNIQEETVGFVRVSGKQ